MMLTTQATGCVLLREEDVPERWRARAVRLALVVLLPQEAAQLLAGAPVTPALDAQDEQLAGLVLAGRAAPEIAKELGVTTRTVYRRLERLRTRLGVNSVTELRIRLLRQPL